MPVLGPRITAPLFMLALAAGSAYGHLPELYGREYLRVDPHEYVPPQNPTRGRSTAIAQQEEGLYERQLRELEAQAGPYSQGLADPLTNLSRAQLLSGDPDEAAANLRRALHLVRVNEGLYSTSQLPLLRQLMALYRENGDYAALGDVYGYYYRVSRVGEGQPDQEKLDGALEYMDWERQLYATRADGRQRDHLMRAYRANTALLEAASEGPADTFIDLAISQMRNLYLILGDKELAVTLGPYSSMPTQAEAQLSALQKVAYGKGRKLLSSCLDRLENAPPLDRARIYLELGDWQHWNGYLVRARQQYQHVIELMQQAGEEEQLAQWFDEPVELPNKKALWPLIHEYNGEEPQVVEVSYEVDRNGEARRVEATTGSKEGQWQASRIRGMIKDTHFRPRIGKDGPEAGPRVTRHYRLIAIN